MFVRNAYLDVLSFSIIESQKVDATTKKNMTNSCLVAKNISISVDGKPLSAEMK